MEIKNMTNFMADMTKQFNTDKALQKIRKLFHLVSIMLLIAASIQFYTLGFVLQVITEYSLCALMISCANKCENVILKRRIDKWLNAIPTLPLDEEN